MTESAINFITEQILEQIEILNINIDEKVTLAKELGKTLTLARKNY